MSLFTSEATFKHPFCSASVASMGLLRCPSQTESVALRDWLHLRVEGWGYLFCQALTWRRENGESSVLEGFTLPSFFPLFFPSHSMHFSGRCSWVTWSSVVRALLLLSQYLVGRLQDWGHPKMTDFCQSVSFGYSTFQDLCYEPHLMRIRQNRIMSYRAAGRHRGLVCKKVWHSASLLGTS